MCLDEIEISLGYADSNNREIVMWRQPNNRFNFKKQ
jgi:hypothetical protein